MEMKVIAEKNTVKMYQDLDNCKVLKKAPVKVLYTYCIPSNYSEGALNCEE